MFVRRLSLTGIKIYASVRRITVSEIAVILTGGTIGSTSKNGVIDVAKSSLLTDEYNRRYKNCHSFKIFRPYDILSENLLPQNWNALVSAVKNIIVGGGFDGIIIAHGTDTLPYTTAVIGMLFGGAKLPIVTVSAGRVLDDPQSNGVINFAAAVGLTGCVNGGVYSVYAEDGQVNVYLATEMCEADGLCDSFVRKNVKPLGRMVGDRLVLNKGGRNVTLRDIENAKKYDFPSLEFTQNIVFLTPYPGLDYSAVNLNGKRAVLHATYHSATACTVGENNSLAEFVKRCKAEGADVYLFTEKPRVDRLYGSTKILTDAGAELICGMTMPTALAKIYIAYNQTDTEPKRLMNEDMFFEQSD